jgi:hypothetical protein
LEDQLLEHKKICGNDEAQYDIVLETHNMIKNEMIVAVQYQMLRKEMAYIYMVSLSKPNYHFGRKNIVL